MSSNITSNQCCFDFGQGETNDSDDGNATMNAIYYGTDCWTGNCTGPGPWVGADIENGMYFSNTGNNPPAYPSENGTFLSAWEENNGGTNMTLQYGNAQSGGLIQTYSGALPSGGYNPMKIQSSIELGTGGDNTSLGYGEFYEAADVSGFPSQATQSAVQANIVAAGYSQTPPGEAPFGGTAPQVPGTVQAANYDTGGSGVGYKVNSVNGTANSYRSDGVDLETTTDTANAAGTGGGYDLGWTGGGQWTRYTVNAAGAGTYAVNLRLASPNGVTDGLHIANLAGTNLSGNINVPATGGWQNWTTVTATLTLPAGTQTLVVDQDNGGWNVHDMNFAPTGVTSSWFEVVNQSSGLCATAAGGSTANGTAVQQSACTGAASQLWKFVPTSVSGYYDVVNDNAQAQDETWNITGGTGATGQGVPLQIWNYGGTGNTNALFSAKLGSSGHYTFTADNSGLCIDAPFQQQRSPARAVHLQRQHIPGVQPGAQRGHQRLVVVRGGERGLRPVRDRGRGLDRQRHRRAAVGLHRGHQPAVAVRADVGERLLRGGQRKRPVPRRELEHHRRDGRHRPRGPAPDMELRRDRQHQRPVRRRPAVLRLLHLRRRQLGPVHRTPLPPAAESSSRSTPATAPRPRRSAWCRKSTAERFYHLRRPCPGRAAPAIHRSGRRGNG